MLTNNKNKSNEVELKVSAKSEKKLRKEHDFLRELYSTVDNLNEIIKEFELYMERTDGGAHATALNIKRDLASNLMCSEAQVKLLKAKLKIL